MTEPHETRPDGQVNINGTITPIRGPHFASRSWISFWRQRLRNAADLRAEALSVFRHLARLEHSAHAIPQAAGTGVNSLRKF